MFCIAWNNFESCATKLLSQTLEQLENCLNPKWKLNTSLQPPKNKMHADSCGNIWRCVQWHRWSLAEGSDIGWKCRELPMLPSEYSLPWATRCFTTNNSDWGACICEAQGSLSSICYYWPKRVIVPLMLWIDFCMKLEPFLILGEKVAPVDWG